MNSVSVNMDYQLADRYTREQGYVYLTGLQMLVRIMLQQKRLDAANGLNTAGFVSGYRGSPLGAFDTELWNAKNILEANDIRFEPGINEDLAATAVWGTQQIDLFPGQKHDGVFGLWYGKGPGVDRSGDVFRCANTLGTAKFGGVLAVAGDDHAAQSSMYSHQTDQTFQSVMMPILNPASVAEFLQLGLAGWAMSRYSGLWVAFKTIAETVETGISLRLPPLPTFRMPDNIVRPPYGFNVDPNLKWPGERFELERRVLEERLPAAQAFAEINHIDTNVWRAPQPRMGIVTTGKAYLDVLHGLRSLGIDQSAAEALGVSLYKVGMTYPLEPQGMRRFAEGLQKVFVIEEKRALVETQLKELMYNWPASMRPQVIGKTDTDGRPLLKAAGEFSPELLARVLLDWLPDGEVVHRARALLRQREQQSLPAPEEDLLTRVPYFCSGCPHNTSTLLPDGMHAGGGIGCHIMVLGQGRKTETFSQMGGEGVAWVGLESFTKLPHLFQNIGDGTYQHSGVLAVRQAVAAGTAITFKILYNDAVAMTGGQSADGDLSVGSVVRQMLAEGVKKVVVVSDSPDKYENSDLIPNQVPVYHRDDLQVVQTELADYQGVSVLLYEQTCAAELRRRRKRSLVDDPPRRLFINERVCEGCDDCAQKSNCISVEPAQTKFGRKRRVNQATCNKDYSCIKGFCPSFVSVDGGQIRKPDPMALSGLVQHFLKDEPDPKICTTDERYNILVAGIGGTGVVTVGSVIAMAAHLEGRYSSLLDFTGLAQKNGAVISYLRIGGPRDEPSAIRLGEGECDLLLGFDMVTAAGPAVRSRLSPRRTKVVLNSAAVPTAISVKQGDLAFPTSATLATIRTAAKKNDFRQVDATDLAQRLFGESIFSNIFLLGYAWQHGWVPVTEVALMRAIELNGVAIDLNKKAFSWGRIVAVNPKSMKEILSVEDEKVVTHVETLGGLIASRKNDLTAYQNFSLAKKFTKIIMRVRRKEAQCTPEKTDLTETVAKYLHKLMACKDEYEVARLYTSEEFMESVKKQFDGNYKLRLNLAPPLLSRINPNTGEPRKITFGPWIFSMFRVLRRFRHLRGSFLDPFGWTQERRMERALIDQYIADIDLILLNLVSDNYQEAVAILALPDMVRGFGHVKLANIDSMQIQREDLLRRWPGISAQTEFLDAA